MAFTLRPEEHHETALTEIAEMLKRKKNFTSKTALIFYLIETYSELLSNLDDYKRKYEASTSKLNDLTDLIAQKNRIESKISNLIQKDQ